MTIALIIFNVAVALIWIYRNYSSKKLESVLVETRSVKICGVIFKIKKLDPFDYMDGSKVLLGVYDVYENKKGKENPQSGPNADKIKAHMRDVFLSSVVSPKLSRDASGEGLPVDNLFTDWTLSNRLYESILSYTYGKKKT